MSLKSWPHGKFVNCVEFDKELYDSMFKAGQKYRKKLEEQCLACLSQPSQQSPLSTPQSNCVGLIGETKTSKD